MIQKRGRWKTTQKPYSQCTIVEISDRRIAFVDRMNVHDESFRKGAGKKGTKSREKKRHFSTGVREGNSFPPLVKAFL